MRILEGFQLHIPHNVAWSLDRLAPKWRALHHMVHFPQPTDLQESFGAHVGRDVDDQKQYLSF